MIFDIISECGRIVIILFFSYLLLLCLISDLNNKINPYIIGNKPDDRFCGIISYNSIYCLDCDTCIDNCYKRSIFGISGITGIYCNVCIKNHI